MISVIIPAFNAAAFLPALLSALETGARRPTEVIVVDDGSTDATVAIAQAHRCRVLHTSHPRSGPAIARNLGAVAATGDVLFFLDADVIPHPDAVARVAAALAPPNSKGGPAIDAVFGSYDDRPADPGFLSQYKNLFHHYVHQHGAEQAATFWTGCGAIRRDVFFGLGGFTDEYGRPCIEDIELGYRLARQGGRIRLDKELLATHCKRWTAANLLRSDIVDRGIPWAELILRHKAFVNDLNLQTHNRVSVVTLWLLIFSLLAAPWAPSLFIFGLGLAGLLLVLNRGLYRWFAARRGPGFALRVIPWHWLYYGYNAIAFAIGLLHYARSPFARGHLTPDRPGALIGSQAQS